MNLVSHSSSLFPLLLRENNKKTGGKRRNAERTEYRCFGFRLITKWRIMDLCLGSAVLYCCTKPSKVEQNGNKRKRSKTLKYYRKFHDDNVCIIISPTSVILIPIPLDIPWIDFVVMLGLWVLDHGCHYPHVFPWKHFLSLGLVHLSCRLAKQYSPSEANDSVCCVAFFPFAPHF